MLSEWHIRGFLKKCDLENSRRGSVVDKPDWIHEDVGLIPGLA